MEAHDMAEATRDDNPALRTAATMLPSNLSSSPADRHGLAPPPRITFADIRRLDTNDVTIVPARMSRLLIVIPSFVEVDAFTDHLQALQPYDEGQAPENASAASAEIARVALPCIEASNSSRFRKIERVTILPFAACD